MKNRQTALLSSEHCGGGWRGGRSLQKPDEDKWLYASLDGFTPKSNLILDMECKRKFMFCLDVQFLEFILFYFKEYDFILFINEFLYLK